MGIKGLFKLIESTFPLAIQEFPVKTLTKKTIFVDTSVLMYRYVSAMKFYNAKSNNMFLFQDEKGRETAHLRGLSCFIKKYEQIGAKLIFVLDGPSPEIKQKEVN